jgi:UDP-GlcNAc3NAcA epimerase
LEQVVSEGTQVVIPLHPRTKKMLHSFSITYEKIKTIPPVSYEEMLCLEQNAKVILTDSGGVQKEAYWLGVPCITLRDETEWIETVQNGWNIIVGSNSDFILDAIRNSSTGKKRPLLYGSGNTAEKIVNRIAEKWLDNSKIDREEKLKKTI